MNDVTMYDLFYAILTVVMPIALVLLGNYIRDLTKNSKYAKAVEAVIDAVNIVQQTYVDELKAAGKFTEAAHKRALTMAVEKACDLMDAGTKKYIEKAFGDLETWLKNMIESQVFELKTQK